jgi:4-amino-4-deoxy-L-arabinose transferase-like glycosyltransferase
LNKIDFKNTPFTRGVSGISLVFLLLALAFLLPRMFGLDQFVTTDEVPWLVRSANFYYALGQRDFEETYIAEHPGVITMWIESVVYLIEFPQYRGFGQGYFDSDKYAQFEEFITSVGVDPHNILIKSRMSTVIVNTFILLISFYFARLLVGTKPAIFSFLLIAFDPFHIAVTRLAHLDGLTSSFLFLSLLSFLAYLQNRGKRVYLGISAVSGSLAWLEKLNGLIILPVIITLSFINYFSEKNFLLSTNSNSFSLIIKRVLKPLFTWVIVFIVAVLILFPAAWENPFGTLSKLTVSPLLVGNIIPTQRVEGILLPTESENNPIEIIGSLFRNNNQLIFLSQSSQFYLRYIKGYLGRATPLILIGLAAAAFGYLFKLSIFEKRAVRRVVLYLFLFWLIYTIFVTLASKSSPKYYLSVFPVLDFVAGLGLFSIVNHFTSQSKFFGKKNISTVLLLIIVILQTVLSIRTYPYYSTYFNFLRRVWSESGEIQFAGSGEGLDQAARYLNQKPDAESLQVMSWYGIGPFSYFFKGKTQPLFSYIWSEDQISILKDMDYLVIYSSQWMRNMPLGLLNHLENVEPEHTIWIDGIEFARIFNVKNLPPEVYQPYNPE